MSVISNFLGFGGDPVAQKNQVPKSLRRLSLSQLSNRIRDLNVASGIDFGDIKSEEDRPSLSDPFGTGSPETGDGPDLGELEAQRRQSDKPLTKKQARELGEKDITKRLNKLGAARRGLIKRVTGARTQRATSISTLLGRGI